MRRRVRLCVVGLALVLPCAVRGWAQSPVSPAATALAAPIVLDREQAGAIMPATVFFRGQSATIQARNSAGLKLPDGRLVLTALVDTSGYSSGVQARYQGYLISEVPLLVGGRALPAGAYGFGFVGDQMIVMDLGAKDLLGVPATHDAELRRPNPLQILPDAAGGFRLYLGRSFVRLQVAP